MNHFSASLILLQFRIFTCLDTNIKYTNYLLHNLNGSRNKLSSIFFLQYNAAHIFATTMQIGIIGIKLKQFLVPLNDLNHFSGW